LKTRVHPLWEYSDHSDPARESEEELVLSEVATHVADVLQLLVDDAASVFNNHPPSRASGIVCRMQVFGPFLFLSSSSSITFLT
ncbi:hypothetical protein BAE44_0010299, partial [Dichanthelium oligosanthes]